MGICHFVWDWTHVDDVYKHIKIQLRYLLKTVFFVERSF